ncbi:Sensor histidine kinase RcsC [Dyadobacter sp. CECT 9275]|uniref:histidine kinase n=2 Tax=Dyadobacter helix TaxID=2822344 RepID=A0A916JAA8_9BACT|nr:Sensor histidine kinase RcsC [Dyadobacter sp. CECT 9275]
MVVVVIANEALDFHQVQISSLVFLGIFACIFISFYTGALSLNRAVNIYITAGAGHVGVSAYVSGGLQSPVTFWCILIPLYAFWLLNQKFAWFWFLVSILMPVSFLLMEIWGIKYQEAYQFFEGDHRYYALTVILFLILNVFIVGNSFENNKISSLNEVNAVNGELRDALNKLEKIRKDLETAEKHKDMFIAQMSHEMRTPMTAILGTSELLNNSPLKEGEEELLQILDRSSKHLLYIIDDILDITKIQTGKFHFQKVSFDLSPILQTVYNTNKLRADEKQISLLLDMEDDIPERFTGDPYRITQILNNVLSNAIKFTNKGEVKLTVGFNQRANILAVTVRDTGIGMSEEELSKVFDIFSQANSDIYLQYGGTGMGLSITKQLVELFQGKIHIKSRPGVGTMVNITLPMDQSNIAEYEQIQEPGLKSRIREKLSGLKILIAEDNEVNQLVIKRILHSEIPTIRIEFASDGDEVLSMVTKTDYDLVLMDIQMPKKNGIETTKIIREHSLPRINTLKIIALTASARKSEAEKCLANGMNGYTSKPVVKEDLMGKIFHLLSENQDFSAT